MPTILTFEVQVTANVFMKARVMTDSVDPEYTRVLAMRLTEGFDDIAKALEPANVMRPMTYEEYRDFTLGGSKLGEDC